ncbi:MAG: multicopper oxidase domain-containing protein [bacterium]
MKRREFIKYGSAGLVTLAVGRYALTPTKKAYGQVIDLDFTVIGADFEMVDGTPVYMWSYADMNNGGPRVPGPVIEAVEGDTIRVRITNDATNHEPHGFAIHGAAGPPIDIGSIDPGDTAVLEFEVPRAGTYMYLDPLNAPVNRVLGLHGALVVLPSDPNELTPYSNPTSALRKLFRDLGNASKGFPGKRWDQKRVFPNGRTWVWVFNEIDPAFNDRADKGQFIDSNDMASAFLPRYFTVNGDSGWFIAHNLNTSPRGKEGEPGVIRSMMAGMGTRPPHIHGNHVYLISKVKNGVNQPQNNVIELDTWVVKPMECIDVLFPFRRPPDVPIGKWPPKEEGFPITYPIHPHDEISVTAGGGQYPQGMMNDWHITEPISVDPGTTPGFTREDHDISFETFGCKPLRISPPTPDRLPDSEVDVKIKRQFFGSSKITMPDGRKVKFWGFEDPDDKSTRGNVPSTLIRVREGQTVHCELKVSKHAHTIHWHGIEGTCFNDGVPHNSFEVKSRYTYQWQAAQAGTFFYHCHVNTVLHFQMGMSGLLIVDPPDGPGKLCSDPRSAYDVEAMWAFADVDPRWHHYEHDAGMCGEDVGFNDFRPQYFMINGVPNPNTLTDPNIICRAKPTDTILFRLLNASYTIQKITMPFDVEVIEIDGRPLYPSSTGGSHSNHDYAHPYTVSAGDEIEMETAQRIACLARGNLPLGEHVVTVKFYDLVHPSHRWGKAETKVIISEDGGGGDEQQPGEDVIKMGKARFDYKRNKWSVKGKNSVPGPGNTVTIHLGPTLAGPVIGTAEAKKGGKWKFKKKNSALLPDETKTISLESSQGAELLGFPVAEKGVPQDPAEVVLKVKRAVFKIKKQEWKIQGKSTFKGLGNIITILMGPDLTGEILGTTVANSKGKWKFKLKNPAPEFVPQEGDAISVISNKGGVVVNYRVRIKK